jgi:hypothetical protein
MNRWMAMLTIEPPTRTPRFCPMSSISRVKRFDKIRKNTPIGANLIRKVMIFITIFSISLTARSSEESGPLIKHPTTIADTRTARSSSLAKAAATLFGTKDSKTCTMTSWAAIPPLSATSSASSSVIVSVAPSATVIKGLQTRSTRMVLIMMARIVVPTYHKMVRRANFPPPFSMFIKFCTARIMATTIKGNTTDMR